MIKEETKPEFHDKLDVYGFLSDIKLRINDNITSDFVLAKLSDKDKEGIIEMTANAYFSRKIIDMLYKRGYKYVDGKKIKLDKTELARIKNIGDAVFDAFMTRIYMNVVLSRNVDKNYLVNVLSGYREEEDKNEIDLDSVQELLKEKLKNQEKEK